MSVIQVIKDKCTGCKLCVKACPYNAITMQEKLAVIDIAKCTLCGACVEACKFEAIVIQVERKKIEGFDDYQGVWVFAEQRDGEPVAPVGFVQPGLHQDAKLPEVQRHEQRAQNGDLDPGGGCEAVGDLQRRRLVNQVGQRAEPTLVGGIFFIADRHPFQSGAAGLTIA